MSNKELIKIKNDKKKENENEKNMKILIYKKFIDNYNLIINKNNNEKILTEDEYLNYIEKIITRDFYPNLLKNKSIKFLPNEINLNKFILNFTSDELQNLCKLFEKEGKEKFINNYYLYKKEIKSLNDPNQNVFGKYIMNNNVFFLPKENNNILLNKKIKRNSNNNNNNNKPFLIKENTRFSEDYLEKIKNDEIQIYEKIFNKNNNNNIDINKLLLSLENKNDNKSIKITEDDAKIPVFTWGKIVEPPKTITNGTFEIQNVPEREMLLNDLVRNLRKKKQNNNNNDNNVGKKKKKLSKNGLKLLNSMRKNNLILQEKNNINNINNNIKDNNEKYSNLFIPKKIISKTNDINK
jgi:hypothetical protein